MWTELLAVGLVYLGAMAILLGIPAFLFYRYVIAKRTASTKICPFCAERIQLAAKVCRHCQREI